jgi:signal peptidase II
MTRVLGLGAIVIVLDQLTKAVILRYLGPGTHIDVVPGFATLTLVMNPGLAFGLLGSVPVGWRWMVAALSLVALAVLARVALRVLPAGGVVDHVAIGLIFGGAIGNLIDRARFGAVVDFVDLHVRGYHWPAFNVADSSISIGVVLLAFRLLRPGSSAADTEPARD